VLLAVIRCLETSRLEGCWALKSWSRNVDGGVKSPPPTIDHREPSIHLSASLSSHFPLITMATFDRRRIPAPEDSKPPVFATTPAGPSRTRANDELRPLCGCPLSYVAWIQLTAVIKTGLVTQANGSAYVEADGVKIACSAYVPPPSL
jgi:hypothetical protein